VNTEIQRHQAEEASSTRTLTLDQEEVLVAIRAEVNGLAIDAAEDAEDEFVVSAKQLLALDLEKIATSFEALAAAVPVLDSFLDACNAELEAEAAGSSPKWYGEVHELEETLKAFSPRLDQVKALEALKPFLLVDQPVADRDLAAHVLKESDADDIILSLQGSFIHVMQDLAKRVTLKDLPSPAPSRSSLPVAPA
jgi:hypothetical protein